MGNYRIVIEGAGPHGCQRAVVEGGQLAPCLQASCPDCRALELVRELAAMGQIREALMWHWPGEPTQIVDDLAAGVRRAGRFPEWKDAQQKPASSAEDLAVARLARALRGIGYTLAAAEDGAAMLAQAAELAHRPYDGPPAFVNRNGGPVAMGPLPPADAPEAGSNVDVLLPTGEDLVWVAAKVIRVGPRSFQWDSLDGTKHGISTLSETKYWRASLPAAPEASSSSPAAPEASSSSPAAPEVSSSSPAAPEVSSSSPAAPEASSSPDGQEKPENA